MGSLEYGIADFHAIAAGAAVLASGGGGSYLDSLSILQQLADSGWNGSVKVQAYDGSTNCCVLAMMGSPDAAGALTLDNISCAINNTLNVMEGATQAQLGCVIPVEIGPINSLVPLIAAVLRNGALWVVNGDGAGRAVPQLPQTTFGGSANLSPTPCALANDAVQPQDIESSVLGATSSSQVETLAGSVVAAFGGYSGIALWPSNASNQFALQGNYIPNTLNQAWELGQLLLNAVAPLTSAEVAWAIEGITGRGASVIASNYYITSVQQATTSASLDCGIIRIDNTPDPSQSTHTYYLYNLNENLLMYSSSGYAPDAIAPDSICYYSEKTGRGFSNANEDLAPYFNAATGESTGLPVSIIRIRTAAQLYNTSGVTASFAALLRKIGYAGALPSA